MLAIREGSIILWLVVEPSDAIILITVDGISWTDVVFMTVKSTIEKVARVPPLCIEVTAFIPRGVAAPPAPNILAARFRETYSRVFSVS